MVVLALSVYMVVLALSVYMVVLALSVYVVVLTLSVYTTGISNCRKELKFTYVIGATFSFSKGIIFIAYAVLFYLGAWLITTKTPNNPQPITFEDMMMYVMLHSLSTKLCLRMCRYMVCPLKSSV